MYDNPTNTKRKKKTFHIKHSDVVRLFRFVTTATFLSACQHAVISITTTNIGWMAGWLVCWNMVFMRPMFMIRLVG